MIPGGGGFDEPTLAFLRALVERAPFGLYVVDADLRMFAFNRAAELVFSARPPIVGRDFAELIRTIWPELVAADAIERFRHTLATGEPYVAPPLTETRKNIDRVESYEWRIERLRLPDGRFGVVCYFYDLTRLREVEAVVAAAAARDAFLIGFADAVRPLTSAVDITLTAARLLAQKLGAGQAAYADFDDTGEYATVDRDWSDGTIPSNAGRHRVRDFGDGLYAELQRGEVLVVPDVQRDPRTRRMPANWERVSVRAFMSVPLVKAGRLVAVLMVSSRDAREWSGADVELARDVAERTWAAAERARVESNLRRTQARLASALEAGLAGTFYWDILADRVTTDENMRSYFALSESAVGEGAPLAEIFPAIHDEDRARVARAIDEAVTGHAVYQIEYRVRHSDGSLRWLSARGLVKRDERGAAAAMAGFLVDITRRKLAELALRASEEKYRTLFESIDEGFGVIEVIVDGEGRAHDYRVLEANPAQEQLTGVSAVVGRRARELWPAMGEAWFEEFGRVARTGEPVRFELLLGGVDRWFDVHASRVGGEGSRQVAVVFNDITGRKRREANAAFLDELSDAASAASTPAELVRAFGERAEKFFGASTCAFIAISAAHDEALVSDAWTRSGAVSLLGRYRLGDYVSGEFQRLIVEGQPVVVRDVATDPRILDRKKIAALGVGSFLNVPLIRGGAWRFALGVYHDRPFAWREDQVELMLEVTARLWSRLERARAEAGLRETELRLQQALEAADLGTFVFHLAEDRGEPDGRMLRLFGLGPDEPLSLKRVLEELVHPDDRARCEEAVREAARPEGAGAMREDLRVVHRDGVVRWLAITARMVFGGPLRRALRLVGLAADISERKSIEAALREREERLRDDDRRKDEFLAVLAHELRNPLAPIRTGLELIRLGGHTPEAVARVRTMMDRQVSHMVRLIDDLLDVSRITSGKIRLQRQPSSLAALIGTAVEADRAALDAGPIALGVELPDEPVILDVDPTRFVQVLSNLLHNAIKFTGAGGWIRVAATVDAARRLKLTVADSGAGISREMLPRVFDLFTQGDAPPPGASAGLGIGLALARRLVELHGGTIEAASDGRGRGSTFTIRLPIDAAARVSTPEPAAEEAAGRAVRQRVVVIDDNADAADTTAMLIEAVGGECRVAYDGERGLAEVLAFRPDVVLLDLGMPIVDGYETCRRIRRALGDAVVIVAVTGWGQERDKEQAARAGFDGHLTKPVSPATLHELLETARPAHPGSHPFP